MIREFLIGWGYILLAASFVYVVWWVTIAIYAIMRRRDPILTFIVLGLILFMGALIYLGVFR